MTVDPVKFLLVDDNEHNLVALEAVLRREGLELLRADSGSQALELLLAHDVALALVDVQMPEMDGFELAELMRGTERTRHVPIIFITAAARDQQRVFKGYEGGAVDFLFKPVEARVLQSKAEVFFRLHRQHQELRAARSAAEAANRAKDEFLAMLSHELRNPLGTIGSAIRLLDAAGKRDPIAARVQDVIVRQVAHLTRLVDDLLEAGRVTAGKITLTCRPVALTELAERVVGAWRTAGRLDHHRVTVAGAPVWVEADETRLEQIVANLVGNALKFTPHGGAVTVSVRVSGGDAILEVEDTGIGMSPELIGYVFDLFAQGERSLDRAEGGLGIGLTLARVLIEQHGGTVAARSAGLDRGSVFTVRLPAIAPPSRGDLPALERDVCAPGQVLIVEDNDDAREMLRFGLEQEGHTVLEATTGPQGVELAISGASEVALIDIGLPGLDGYEVARRIRAAMGRRVTLVALTGYGAAEDRVRAEEAGFDAYLVKPIDPEKLVAVIAASPRQPA